MSLQEFEFIPFDTNSDRANLHSLHAFSTTSNNKMNLRQTKEGSKLPATKRNLVSVSSATTRTTSEFENTLTQTKFHFHSDLSHSQGGASLDDGGDEGDFEVTTKPSSNEPSALHEAKHYGATPKSHFNQVLAITALSGRSCVLIPSGQRPPSRLRLDLSEPDEDVMTSLWFEMQFEGSAVEDDRTVPEEEPVQHAMQSEWPSISVVAVLATASTKTSLNSETQGEENQETRFSLKIYGTSTDGSALLASSLNDRKQVNAFESDIQTLDLDYAPILLRAVPFVSHLKAHDYVQGCM